ncbi:hypothetical protein [Nodosilinea nodulosa]|nr:hypothetical protein [Nodosilinea nodulosa]
MVAIAVAIALAWADSSAIAAPRPAGSAASTGHWSYLNVTQCVNLGMTGR